MNDFPRVSLRETGLRFFPPASASGHKPNGSTSIPCHWLASDDDGGSDVWTCRKTAATGGRSTLSARVAKPIITGHAECLCAWCLPRHDSPSACTRELLPTSCQVVLVVSDHGHWPSHSATHCFSWSSARLMDEAKNYDRHLSLWRWKIVYDHLADAIFARHEDQL